VRLPGSGGACEIALNARRVIVVMSQSPRSFVERVDFVTSPGHHRPDGSGRRPAWAGAGPTAVVTQLGLFHFGADGEMELAGVHPGVEESAIDAATGWSMRRAAAVATLPQPSAQTLATIRSLLA
jgi:glutaconate CoA-transferase subunit B